MARTFTLIRNLGQGAHGSVHLAEVRDDLNYVQTLALKRLHPDGASTPGMIARLEHDAQRLDRLRHENIVRVHGFTTIDGALAIQLEPVYGVDLATLVERTLLPARVSTEIVVAVADALDAAWTAHPGGQAAPLRLVHGDLKPSHVMVTPRGAVRILDFGVARVAFEGLLPDAGAPWLAPERRQSGEPSHAADVYALGITFLELLTGAPVSLRADSEAAYLDERDAYLAEIEPPDLRDLVASMTAYRPEARPEAVDVVTTALELLPQIPGSDLRSWAGQHVTVEAPEDEAAAMILREDTTAHGLPALTPVPAEPRRESSWGWLASLVGFASLLGITLGWAIRWMIRASVG